jgi:hypothetical protein
MLIRYFMALTICAAASLPAGPASAAKKQNSAGKPAQSVQAKCLQQVGAVYHPAEQRWYFSATGYGSPQEQAYYACLDQHLMGKR